MVGSKFQHNKPLATGPGATRLRMNKTLNKESAVLRIRLLGRFQVSVGSRRIPDDKWRSRKAGGVIKLLALSPGHGLHREQAMNLLWPRLDPKAASNNLHQAPHIARRILEPGSTTSRYLRLRDEFLTLCPGGRVWTDVEAFSEAASSARHGGNPAAYQAAVELYAGDLLPEDRYEEWVESRRMELRKDYLDLLIDMARLHEERTELEPAIRAFRRVVEEEPAHEEAHTNLMRLYALSGRRGEAMEQYDQLREVMRRRHGAEPGAASKRLHGEIVAGLYPPAGAAPEGPPADNIREVPRHNLPIPRTSFVGREREMLEVKRELSMTRLLTLTGTGGAGKTRLSLEVAGDLAGAYPDGVWMVELAPLSEGDLVPQTIAETLKVREQPGRPPADSLIEALRDKKLLLVLDNCEHLVDATAHLVDRLLERCPGLRVLATSREALGVPGEVNLVVPSLSMPGAHPSLTGEELAEYESARLFMQRSPGRSSPTALTSGNARDVAEICRQLEGIPLAIELAAARVGVLTFEQISDRLRDSLRLLTGGGRTATSRQRTLRGALDWSYDLLSEPERMLFARLSVFTGGWTLEAAEEIGAVDGMEHGGVLDLLGRLVDQSLVVAEAAGDGEIRYRLLEPVRQYAREKLEERAEDDALRRRHALWFLDLAESAYRESMGPRQEVWLKRLETELDNVRTALRWSLELEEAETGLQLAAILYPFWILREHMTEGRNWLRQLLAIARPDQITDFTRASALNAAGVLAQRQGDVRESITLTEEALILWRELGDQNGLAECLSGLCASLAFKDDYEQAAPICEEGLVASRAANHQIGIIFCLNNLGLAMRGRGDYARARELHQEALVECRGLEQTAFQGWVLGHLSQTEIREGNIISARAHAEEGLALSRQLGDSYGMALALETLGMAALAQGDPDQAEKFLIQGLKRVREPGFQIDTLEYLDALAYAANARERPARAARLLGAAEALREEIEAFRPPPEHATHARETSSIRDQLDEATWKTAWAEGCAMSLEEAVEYALTEESAPPAEPKGAYRSR
jgi:predicted ATPase/DNA-binding SARP family transcriptional activator